jgi:dolichyl-phosphate-mannose--protein O-mannosyl transferase
VVSLLAGSVDIFRAVLPQLFLFGMLLTLLLALLHFGERSLVRNKTSDQTHEPVNLASALPLILCFIAFAGYWLPWARSPRIMFFYHFFPPMTFFYPLIGYVLYRMYEYSHKGRVIVLIYCAIVLLSFCYFYPHVTGWLMPVPQREAYFWLNSWK